MGTNYDWIYEPDKCPHCGRSDSVRIHIGKSSAGWCFSLRVDDPRWHMGCFTEDEFKVASLADWVKLFAKPDSRIEDEYGESIEPAAMIATIRRETVGGKPLSYSQPKCNVSRAPYGYVSWAAFHRDNHSEPGPRGFLRHRIDGRHCVAHGDGAYDLMVGARDESW